MKKILEQAKALQTQIVEDRHALHRRPEIGFHLPETAAYVRQRLSEMGIPSQPCGGPIDPQIRQNFIFAGFPDMEASTGLTAVIGSGSPCILLRADMDALPMPESPGHVDFPSEKDGLAHMCGHDAHTAMLLGTAKILKDMEDELPGTVKLMFQTGEECGCGSKFMVEQGVLENPQVDAALALHVMSQQDSGTIEYTTGITSAAMDTYFVKIKGKGGHSSTPQETIDPLMIANQLYTALNLLPAREIDPQETVALTVGQVSGGTTANIIPDTSRLVVSFRSFSRNARAHLNQRIPEIIEHTVKMWRGAYELIDFHTPSAFTDEPFSQALTPYIKEIVGDEQVRPASCMPGSEDFGYISEKVPSMFVRLGAGDASRAPMHNPDMTLDEDVFWKGSAILANCAFHWLDENK